MTSSETTRRLFSCHSLHTSSAYQSLLGGLPLPSLSTDLEPQKLKLIHSFATLLLLNKVNICSGIAYSACSGLLLSSLPFNYSQLLVLSAFGTLEKKKEALIKAMFGFHLNGLSDSILDPLLGEHSLLL